MGKVYMRWQITHTKRKSWKMLNMIELNDCFIFCFDKIYSTIYFNLFMKYNKTERKNGIYQKWRLNVKTELRKKIKWKICAFTFCTDSPTLLTIICVCWWKNSGCISNEHYNWWKLRPHLPTLISVFCLLCLYFMIKWPFWVFEFETPALY